ncbi:MAG: hypothetical protein R3C16_03845 [Hyphomonadaceae bacterium]
MRKYLMGAAALAAFAAPGLAHADSAQVGLGIANADFSGGGGDADFLRLEGAYSHNTGNGLVLQLDGLHDRIDIGPGDLGNSYGAVNLGVRSDTHAFYGFVGLSDMVALSGVNLGIGGQLYMSRATINASLGYADFDTADVSITDLHVDGTWFFTDNFGVGAEAGWAEGEFSPDIDWTTLGLFGTYRFAGSPVSVNLGYRNQDFDGGGEVDTWRLGFTYNIGTSSEIERSRDGASFNGARELFESSYVLLY